MPAEAEGSAAPEETPDKATAPWIPGGVDVSDDGSEYTEEAIAAAMRDAELVEKYEGSPSVEEAVDIRDEASQKNFDQMTVSNTIRALREALANQKVNYWLAAKGLLVAPQGARAPHPNQIKLEISKTRQQLEWLIAVSRSDEAIEYPSDLEVAAALPQQGEAVKLGLAK